MKEIDIIVVRLDVIVSMSSMRRLLVDVWLFEYDEEVDWGNATTDKVTQVA